MGVPAFFRWLSLRCPQIIQDAIEDCNRDDLIEVQGDSFANPEIDNLYLDMNGLIHPCTHPENQNIPIPTNEKEMFRNIYNYIDMLISIVKPKKILYLAIDGVAPRAKMNQQRGRRFKAGRESYIQKNKKRLLKNQLELKFNKELSEIDIDGQEKFDHNVITPGTPFMARLSAAIQNYIKRKMEEDELWKGLQVIYSDWSIPGEGEHKILEFIRLQRISEHYDPNTRHCIYGADADLIMLGLMTHEPWFYIIRETVMTSANKRCSICNSYGHFYNECSIQKQQQEARQSRNNKDILVNFQFIKLFAYRQLLELDFKNIKTKMEFNLENIIDDFIFLCFFVGNDFLPHLPTLDISKGGIDCLLHLYKHLLPELEGYLTENGDLELERVNRFIGLFSKVENTLLKNYAQNQFRINSRPYDRDQDKSGQQSVDYDKMDFNEIFKIELKKSQETERKEEQEKQRINNIEEYRQIMQGDIEEYKKKYYTSKFNISESSIEEMVGMVEQKYIEGLSWVYQYYYKGCVSWEWYYPFHYAPFAQDLKRVANLKIEFKYGSPIKPIDQLMAVLSPYSIAAIPGCLKKFMTDPDSEIIDFYPLDFKVDIKGKRFAWMGEVLLPFIEIDRLLGCIRSNEDQMEHEEKQRNQLGCNYLYINQKQIVVDDQTIKYDENRLEGTIENKKVFRQVVQRYQYCNPSYKQHQSVLLNGVVLPPKLISDDILERTNNKSFNGQQVVQIVERCLGIRNDSYDRYGNYNVFNKFANFNEHYNNNNVAVDQPVYYKSKKTKRLDDQQAVVSDHINKKIKYSDQGCQEQHRQNYRDQIQQKYQDQQAKIQVRSQQKPYYLQNFGQQSHQYFSQQPNSQQFNPSYPQSQSQSQPQSQSQSQSQPYMADQMRWQQQQMQQPYQQTYHSQQPMQLNQLGQQQMHSYSQGWNQNIQQSGWQPQFQMQQINPHQFQHSNQHNIAQNSQPHYMSIQLPKPNQTQYKQQDKQQTNVVSVPPLSSLIQQTNTNSNQYKKGHSRN